MGASELGQSLLREIEAEGGGTLDQILRQVQILAAKNSPKPASRFKIKPLDELVNHAVSRASFPAPARDRPGQEADSISLATLSSKQDAVVELTSSVPGAGKTQLLYLITCMAILPSRWAGLAIDGKDSIAVIIDADARFNALRLAQVLRTHLTRCQSQPHDRSTIAEENLTSFEALIEESLKHVHIFQPQSLASLVETVAKLDGHLSDHSAHSSHQRQVHSIIIDGMSAFHYQQRAQDENIGASATASSSFSTTLYQKLSKSLKELQRMYGCSVILTTAAAESSKQRNHTSPSVSVIPGLIPTVRLRLSRKQVPPFPPMMSVQDAERDRAARQRVVERGIFGVWSEDLREGFWYRIAQDGVFIEEKEIEK